MPIPRMKFDLMEELVDIVCVDATPETKAKGETVNLTIREHHSTRAEMVKALSNDPDICAALKGHSIDIAVLASVSVGCVTDEFSTLVLKKVREHFKVVLH